jgi:hypothetical protein
MVFIFLMVFICLVKTAVFVVLAANRISAISKDVKEDVDPFSPKRTCGYSSALLLRRPLSFYVDRIFCHSTVCCPCGDGH